LWTNDQGEETRTTFKELKEQTDQAASYLMSLGIGKNDPVMLILKRRYEWWVVMLALHKIGAIVIPATFLLTAKDIVYRAEAASVKMIICVDEPVIIGHVQQAAPQMPNVSLYAAVGDTNIPEGWIDYRKEIQQESTEWEKPTGADYPCLHDPMLMYFTSGTSGMPKMILHDYTYPLGHIVTAKYWQRVQDGGRHMTAADSGWAKFAWGKIYGQWLCGAVIAAYDMQEFKADRMLRAIEKLHLTTFCAPPTIYRFLIKEDWGNVDLSSIKQCSMAGEPLNPAVYQQWLKLTGLPLVEGFGQSEGTVLIANFPWFPIKPGFAGKFAPVYDFELVNEDQESDKGDGSMGTLVIRHAQEKRPVGLFREYYRDPEAMATYWKNGDYSTGDVLWQDEDGYLQFIGRNDDVIKCSGYRIGPFEVESALMEHEAVLECAVTAAPDPIRGEVVKATIVLVKNRGYEPSQELVKELQNHVKRVTAPYKYPRIVEFVDELPKSTSGKIMRKKIRENDQKE
jgi:acetyl-CoA synthetase